MLSRNTVVLTEKKREASMSSSCKTFDLHETLFRDAQTRRRRNEVNTKEHLKKLCPFTTGKGLTRDHSESDIYERLACTSARDNMLSELKRHREVKEAFDLRTGQPLYTPRV